MTDTTSPTTGDDEPAASRHDAERRYRRERCGDCFCCTVAQCAEDRCPENAVGESICPCTCY